MTFQFDKLHFFRLQKSNFYNYELFKLNYRL